MGVHVTANLLYVSGGGFGQGCLPELGLLFEVLNYRQLILLVIQNHAAVVAELAGALKKGNSRSKRSLTYRRN